MSFPITSAMFLILYMGCILPVVWLVVSALRGSHAGIADIRSYLTAN
ncbi:MAG TPA: hypothetical protein VKU01_32170 [Bryobacteraceae bacterium]|nr:hypothetical protein [Bryobacteraceae bacterium]